MKIEFAKNNIEKVRFYDLLSGDVFQNVDGAICIVCNDGTVTNLETGAAWHYGDPYREVTPITAKVVIE